MARSAQLSDWSPQQREALLAIAHWQALRCKVQPIFRLFGYAGTGKTTLLRQLAECAQEKDGYWPVRVGAFTGKAAHVLRTKGVAQAQTVHSMIYYNIEHERTTLEQLKHQLELLKSEGAAAAELCAVEQQITAAEEKIRQPMFGLNTEALQPRPELIIIDECSMLSAQMASDLAFFRVPTLVTGDQAQLPPVNGTGAFMDEPPDVLLTEIHRQAANSPIIALATTAREGQPLRYGEHVIKVMPSKWWEQCDQLLVGTNASRRYFNKIARMALGYVRELPGFGDKLICLKNDHSLGLLNGSQWVVLEADHRGDAEMMQLRLQGWDDDRVLDCRAYKAPFLGVDMAMRPWFERSEAAEFDYGYAITVHKAQGSQWPRVMVFDESYAFRRDRDKWLYTAITRAMDQVLVVKGR